MMRNVFRFRALILVLIYLVGFVAPWEGDAIKGNRGTFWLGASTLLARTGWISLADATLAVTCIALCCLVLGAILRVSGTAYLSAPIMRDARMHGDRMVSAGPYRFLRNPLYLGGWLVGMGTSILMPLSGAIFFFAALTAMELLLIRGEEQFLSSRLGPVYEEYRRRVPRLLPRIRHAQPGIAAGNERAGAEPHWFASFVAEIFAVGFTLCFAVLAWRYNVQILIKCLLVCYGLSLIARALRPKAAEPVAGTAG